MMINCGNDKVLIFAKGGHCVVVPQQSIDLSHAVLTVVFKSLQKFAKSFE